MSKERKWWEDYDDEEEENQEQGSTEVALSESEVLDALEVINRKAERGAALGSIAALLSIRTLKAVQLQETRLEAFENGEKPEKKIALPSVVKIGRFELKTDELLQLPEETLERILECAQETLEDPDFGEAVEEILRSEEILQLTAGQVKNDEGE